MALITCIWFIFAVSLQLPCKFKQRSLVSSSKEISFIPVALTYDLILKRVLVKKKKKTAFHAKLEQNNEVCFKNSSFIELQSQKDEKALKGHLVTYVPHSKINYTHIIFDRCLANLFFTASKDGNSTGFPKYSSASLFI